MSWLAATAVLGMQTGVEILLGMLGPLAVAAGTWLLVERTHRQNPGRVTSVMLKAFAGKIVFFGAYVAVVLQVPTLRPGPFVISFTGYFITLYLIEALCLQRLFAGDGVLSMRHKNRSDVREKTRKLLS